MRIRALLAAALATTAATAGIVAVDTSVASAGSARGCTYPRVCFYLTEARSLANNPTASYQDITTGYQDLGSSSEGSFSVYNTRNDDGALLHYTNGYEYCLPPNRGNAHIRGEIVDKIRIMNSPTCGR